MSLFFFFCFFFSPPPLSELISRYLHTGLLHFSTSCWSSIQARYIMAVNDNSERETCVLTVRVVVVLIINFHLHCLAPALECKQTPLPGSAKTHGRKNEIPAWKNTTEWILYRGWLALSPQRKKAPGYFVCRVCMFSSHSPQMHTFKFIGDSKFSCPGCNP